MKIKHVVISDASDLELLLDPVIAVCTASYATAAMQDASLAPIKEHFKESLDALLHRAFEIGKRIGETGADNRDLVMYD